MQSASAALRQLIDSVKPRLEAIGEATASSKPVGGKWSCKEILGHIIDSEANNRQRIVRIQYSEEMVKIGYDQEKWVGIQDYQSERWDDLVSTWYSANRHLAHVIGNIDPAALERTCDMDYEEPKTLRFVVEDYIRHVEHHLEQILSGVRPEERKKWSTQG